MEATLKDQLKELSKSTTPISTLETAIDALKMQLKVVRISKQYKIDIRGITKNSI
ncbi:hypothetical protein GCM10009430_11870 [Aquimarina litoralis]|uniref:Uncharacterized protein n=1 Tax=Aquimarina litoralis TaxID=584605 RepID=A0ABP3TR36_9FLAO